MKRTLAILSLLTLVVGCSASWQTIVQKSIRSQVVVMDAAAAFAVGVCEPVLQECIANRTNPCPALDKCQDVRKKALVYLKLAAQSLDTAAMAAEAGDRKDADAAVDAALRAYKLAMSILGEIKGG